MSNIKHHSPYVTITLKTSCSVRLHITVYL